jgi:hypothetical protein
MSLEKKIVVDLIEILEPGIIQVRIATRIFEDGKEISSKLHRNLIEPGQNYSNQDARVQAVCAAVHTPEVIAAYQAAQEAAKPAALEV